MKIDLTPTEVSLLLYFMETLGDKYSVAGCNDLKVYNSQDMLEIISQSFEDEEDEHGDVPTDVEIYAVDFMVLGYLKRKISNQAEIQEVPIPNVVVPGW
jgi:hypothetical protein